MSSKRSSSQKISRRSWAAFLVATPLASLPLFGQATVPVPPHGSVADTASPSTPEGRTQKAAAEVRKVSDRLGQIDLPMNIEPAFSFRA